MQEFTYIHTMTKNRLEERCVIGLVMGDDEGLSFLLYERHTDAGTKEFISSVSIAEMKEADRLFCKRVGRMAGKGFVPIYQPKIQKLAFGEYLFDNAIGEHFPYHSFKPITREYERMLGFTTMAAESRPEYELLENFGAF